MKSLRVLGLVLLCLALLLGSMNCSVGGESMDRTPPSPPANLTKTTPDNDNTPTFTWDDATDDDSGVAYYLVCVDSGQVGQLSAHVGGATTYTFYDAISDGSHTFKVGAVDKAGNPGSLASLAFIIDAGSVQNDTTAPSISGITASVTSSSSATITWSTNESATSQVEFGTTSSYGLSTALDTSLVVSHSVNLTGLNAGATYHYRVRSKDASNNETVSGDNSFPTPARQDITPPVISNVASTSTTSGATVTWNTNEAATSQVEYGLTTGYGSNSALDTVLVNNHSVTLTGLASATTYHYRVKSKDGASNEAVSGDFSFTTAVPPDITPPVISGVGFSNITTSSAAIYWTTNEAATSQVEYGLTTSYGSTTTQDTRLTTNHSLGLTGLISNTTYHFRVISRDASNNVSRSGDFTFRTKRQRWTADEAQIENGVYNYYDNSLELVEAIFKPYGTELIADAPQSPRMVV
jgi:phosphodiesterase/alkaline phosphatase D-like protein